MFVGSGVGGVVHLMFTLCVRVTSHHTRPDQSIFNGGNSHRLSRHIWL